MAKKLKQLQSPDQLFQRFQGNVAEVLDPLLANPILQGRQIDGLVFRGGGADVGGIVEVEHGLGRPFLGWFVVRTWIDGAIGDDGVVLVEAPNRFPERVIRLYNYLGNATVCHVSIWVY